MGKFSETIARLNGVYKERLRVTMRESTQTTISLAQRVKPQGGRMRVDTGFLRASIQAAVGQMPSGQSKNEEGIIYPVGSVVSGEPVSVSLLRWNPLDGSSFFVGWTANYAQPREHKDGFLRGATEVWDRTVDKTAMRVRAQIV